jgi:hypothetical protein
MKKFNEWLAVNITLAASTMWMFYLFVIYGLIPVFFPAIQDKILYWSNFVQLIFLPLLAVGSSVLGKSAEKQAQETHDAVMTELSEMKEILSILHSQNKEES